MEIEPKESGEADTVVSACLEQKMKFQSDVAS